jgi:hypothetical protein
MKRLLLLTMLILFLAFPAWAQERTQSIQDYIYSAGYAHNISDVVALTDFSDGTIPGWVAWILTPREIADNWHDVLLNGRTDGLIYFYTDNSDNRYNTRLAVVYLYQDERYLYVFNDQRVPGAHVLMDNGIYAWHGQMFKLP